MKYKLQAFKYLIFDLLSAIISWSLFFIYRKYTVDPNIFEKFSEVTADTNLYLGITIIPLFWIFLYYLAGTYRKVYRKSRLKELSQTFSITFLGVVIIFFTLILDDIILSYKSYYRSFLVLFGLHFTITYLFRLALTSYTNYRIHKKKIGFNTLIVGSNGNAVDIYQQIENQERASGEFFIGFVNVYDFKEHKLSQYLPHLGNYKDMGQVIRDHAVEEVVIATEHTENGIIEQVMSHLDGSDVVIKIIPKMQDILVGSVKVGGIFETPLIQISPQLMPAWQQTLKRIIDIVVSLIAITLLSPLYIFCIIGVATSSPGSIIYSQKRVGLHGRPFKMHKFRSMVLDAEKDGIPRLSSDDDPRITRFGKFMRKTRLDELPQFFTVLKGDMSIVGRGPKGNILSIKLQERAPHYRMLHRIKPGITSWGQVKYGYASNVDEMIKRLKYDILYLENMSLAMDLKS